MQNSQVIGSLITGTIGCIFILIGEATPQWVTLGIGGTTTIGLFVVCGPGGCISYASQGSVTSAKALVVIGFLCSAAGVIVFIVYYVNHIRKEATHRTLSLVIAILFIGGGAAALIGAIIFGAAGKPELELALSTRLDLGYSFGLTIVGGIITGVAGGLALTHRLGIQN